VLRATPAIQVTSGDEAIQVTSGDEAIQTAID
jgi:hypothetical protein